MWPVLLYANPAAIQCIVYKSVMDMSATRLHMTRRLTIKAFVTAHAAINNATLAMFNGVGISPMYSRGPKISSP